MARSNPQARSQFGERGQKGGVVNTALTLALLIVLILVIRQGS